MFIYIFIIKLKIFLIVKYLIKVFINQQIQIFQQITGNNTRLRNLYITYYYFNIFVKKNYNVPLLKVRHCPCSDIKYMIRDNLINLSNIYYTNRYSLIPYSYVCHKVVNCFCVKNFYLVILLVDKSFGNSISQYGT